MMKRLIPMLAGCLVLGTTGAHAELPANAVASLDAAYADFQALATQTKAKGAMPRWSVPADRPVLQRMFDAPALLGSPPYQAQDFPLTLKILAKELALLKDYLTFSPDGTQPDADKNLVMFQDETSRISAMLIRINAVYVPAITRFVGQPKPDAAAAIKPGLAKLANGISQEFSGVAAMITSPAISADNRAILVDAVAASGEPIAAGVTIATRETYAAKMEPTLPTLSADEKTKMQTFLQAMASKDCTGLCALQK